MTSEELRVHNQPEYSVSELAGAVKRTVEGTFSHVRVRGEISGFKRAASGHLYMDLKDDKAVINTVCWKGVAARLAIRPEEGMEVICTGRMSTYPGRSNYQLVVEQMEMAGEGALLALLEKRKKALAAEGLFDAERKLPLPFLPRVIGVVTSPTGAVIRDILHRLEDRFPVRVLVWPVLVQGKGAEQQIAEAINGFNAFDGIATPPKPDVMIVARGGGSIEDLWCFNEEMVVRAAASSNIPLISAVGHETDTTLIDYASSRRAPTPTAAAEMAVPVLADLLYTLNDYEQRLHQTSLRRVSMLQERLEGVARGLISPQTMLENKLQRADEWAERLDGSIRQRVQRLDDMVRAVSERVSPAGLRQRVGLSQERMEELAHRLQQSIKVRHTHWQERFTSIAERVVPDRIHRELFRNHDSLKDAEIRLRRGWQLYTTQQSERLEASDRMLQAMSHESVLKRGFAYVTNVEGALIDSRDKVTDETMALHFQDGAVNVVRSGATPKPSKPMSKRPAPKQTSPRIQESLF